MNETQVLSEFIFQSTRFAVTDDNSAHELTAKSNSAEQNQTALENIIVRTNFIQDVGPPKILGCCGDSAVANLAQYAQEDDDNYDTKEDEDNDDCDTIATDDCSLDTWHTMEDSSNRHHVNIDSKNEENDIFYLPKLLMSKFFHSCFDFEDEDDTFFLVESGVQRCIRAKNMSKNFNISKRIISLPRRLFRDNPLRRRRQRQQRPSMIIIIPQRTTTMLAARKFGSKMASRTPTLTWRSRRGERSFRIPALLFAFTVLVAG